MKNVLCAAVTAAVTFAMPATSFANCYVPARGMNDGDPFTTGMFETAQGTLFAVDVAPFYNSGRPVQQIGGFAEIQAAPNPCFGDKLALRMNNASVRVTILRATADTSTISFNVCDYGGHENGGVRRVNPHDFRDDLSRFNGVQLVDDFGNDVVGEVRSSGRDMKVAYRGKAPLVTAVMGGQELFINSICVD